MWTKPRRRRHDLEGSMRGHTTRSKHGPQADKRKLFPPPECKDGPYSNSQLLFSRSKVNQWKADRKKKYPWTPPANDNNAPTANDNMPDAEQAVCRHCGKPISDPQTAQGRSQSDRPFAFSSCRYFSVARCRSVRAAKMRSVHPLFSPFICRKLLAFRLATQRKGEDRWRDKKRANAFASTRSRWLRTLVL